MDLTKVHHKLFKRRGVDYRVFEFNYKISAGARRSLLAKLRREYRDQLEEYPNSSAITEYSSVVTKLRHKDPVLKKVEETKNGFKLLFNTGLKVDLNCSDFKTILKGS